MAKESVPTVETRAVGSQKPFHPGDQVGLRRFHHQMKMVSHQTIGVNLPIGFGAGFAQRFQEPLTVRVVLENRLATITSDS